jgi:hypothetical protein
MGILLFLAAVACLLAGVYFCMTPMQRLKYRMRVRSSFSGAGRCRECGDRAESRNFPFCSEEHAEKNASSTAW